MSLSSQFSKPLHRWLLAALAMLSALLFNALLRGWLPSIYIPEYKPNIMTTTSSLRTVHCVGRYLITLPSNFELITGGWGDIELYYGLDKNFETVYATVKPGLYTEERFWKEVNQRHFELKGTINAETKGSMLLNGEQLSSVSALLRRLPDEFYAGSIKSEVHVLVGQRYTTLEQKSYSNSQVLDNISYKTADPAKAEARLKLIGSKLLPYRHAERAKPGFCMQDVLFDVGQDDETAKFSFRSQDLGDAFLDVNYHAVTGQPSKGILERQEEALASYPPFRTSIATLRERKTQLGGESAEESLTKAIHPMTQHIFNIERRDGERRTLDRPFFGIRLTTGNEYEVPVEYDKRPPDTHNVYYLPKNKTMVHREGAASLSDEQVLKLWNEIVASVRKR